MSILGRESVTMPARCKNVKKARRRVGLSQEDLAHEAGVNRSFVGQIERCLANPSLDVIVKLATALRVDVADLLKR
jgi:transcriptional regulator with XRE-family HTH domain